MIRLMPVFLIAIIFLLLDFYVFQGIETISMGFTSQLLTKGINGFYWLISISVIVGCFLAIFEASKKRKFTSFAKGVFNVFLTFFIAKLVFVFILLGEDIYRGLAGAFQYFGGLNSESSIYPHRNKYISILAAVVSGIPFLAFIHGITKGKYKFKVHKQVLEFDDLPANFDGFKIVQISDIHSGSFDNPEAIQKGIDLVKEQDADLVVFTGDLVNSHASEIVPWIPYFNQIKAPHGQFSIIGNHDYGDYVSWNSREEKIQNFEMLKYYHKEIGFRLLLDENASIEKDGQKISLLGVENWGLGFGQRGDLNKALNGVDKDAFKVLLSHDPSHWDAQVKSFPVKIHLTLSGHTHGMQFGFEIGKFKWSPVKYKYPNWSGLASENDRYLYVNRGFGFHGFSGRVGIWPEITVIELRRKE
jgi:uncharacterized protein